MPQFQVYRLPDGMLVVDLQSDLLRTRTRVVAPLLPATDDLPPLTRLEPVFEVDGVRLALHTAELAAIPERLVREAPVADLRDSDDQIRRALDIVFLGF